MSPIEYAIIGYITGFLLGFNPILISVFSSFITSMIGKKYNVLSINFTGFTFLAWFGLLVIATSNIAYYIFNGLSYDYLIACTVVFGLIGVVVGILQIRRYFWQDSIIKPSKDITSLVHSTTTKRSGLLNSFVIVLLCFILVIPTIGIVILMLSLGEVILGHSSYWAILFTIGLLTPIYAILAMLGSGYKPSAIIAWKENHKDAMRLYSGLTAIVIVWIVLYLTVYGANI
jgi:hypothetical protein